MAVQPPRKVTLEELIEMRKAGKNPGVVFDQSAQEMPVIEAPVGIKEVVQEQIPAKVEEAPLPPMNTETNWLAAALPLLMGGLVGGKEGLREGAGGAAKTLRENEKNRSDFNTKLLTLANSRRSKQLAGQAKHGKGQYQFHNVEMDGGNRGAIFDSSTGGINYIDTPKGYKMDYRTDPRTKDLVNASGNTPLLRGVERSASVPQGLSLETSPLDAQVSEKVYKDATKQLEPKRAVLRGAKTLASLLDNPNYFSTTAIGQMLNTMFEGKGRMTDEDARRYINPPVYDAIVSRLSILKDGRPDPKVEQEIRQLVSTLAQDAQEAYQEDLNRIEGSYRGAYPGVKFDKVLEPFRTEGSQKIDARKTAREMAKNPAIKWRGLQERIINGRKAWFEKTDKGWEMID